MPTKPTKSPKSPKSNKPTSWFGKLLGGSIGLFLGGPLGAVAGVALGHLVDTMAEQGPNKLGPAPLSPHEQAQTIFFVTTFSLLGKMAKADGIVTHEEIRAVEDFMRHNLRLDLATRAFAIEVFNEAKGSHHSFEGFAEQFYAAFNGQPVLLRGMLEMLYRVAAADGVLHGEEEALLGKAARIFRIPAEESARLRQQLVPDASKHYAVLGCAPTAPMEAIKKRYRELTREYHPDHVIAKGMPDEFVEFANHKLQEINEAYEVINKERGRTSS